MNAFKRSIEEPAVGENNDLKENVRRGLMRELCLFVFDISFTNKGKKQSKKVYIYKTQDNGVFLDFFNDTQEKGILLDMDQWVTLLDKLGLLTTSLNAKQACSVYLSDKVQGRVNLFMRKAYLHLREYYTGHDGNPCPTATGISMASGELGKFVEHLPKMKRAIQILHTLPNVVIGDDTYTLYLEKEEEGVFHYILIEKSVRFQSSHRDLQKVLEVYLKEREVERLRKLKVVENKNKLDEMERKKIMLVSIVECQKRKNVDVEEVASIDKTRVCEVFFRAGESLGMKIYSPLSAMEHILSKHIDLVVDLVQEKKSFPRDFEPYVECVVVTLEKLEEMEEKTIQGGKLVLQPILEPVEEEVVYDEFDDL